MKNTKITKKQSRITSFNIGRVYNLGNYENLRIEFTVEVPENHSVKRALLNARHIINAASPKCPVAEYEVKSAIARIKDPQAWHKNVVNKKERRTAIRKMVQEAKATLAKYEAWKRKRAWALNALDEIGATMSYKDAKRDWHDDDDQGWNDE